MSKRFPVVGVGASAGGLEAFGELLKHLSPDTGMAFVFVQHLDPSHASMLSTLLSRASPVPVHEASDGIAFEPNHAYVIPPNTYLAIADGVFRLTPRPTTRGAPMPVDYFFCSLAEQLGSMAVGVVLSGTASDGAVGLVEIKAKGGLTFAQDEQTAGYAGMPRAAVKTGSVDFVLPPADIATELSRIARSPGTLRDAAPAKSSGLVEGSPDLRRVLALMQQVTGADLGYYKRPTLLRRLARRMLLLDIESLHAYAQHVQDHPAELTALHHDILINVTGFFRDPQLLCGLSERVFPALVKDRRADAAIRIWVPGCSSGEEAYSIGIGLIEYLESAGVSFPIQIFATDLSERAVTKCRTGLYGHELAVSPERLARFFTKTEHGYQVSKTLRDLCVFAKHNLLADPPFSQLDLISCRNVLIYLRPEYQRRAFDLFHYALRESGFLILGRSESAAAAGDVFTAVDKPTRVYAKKPGARSPARFAIRLDPPAAAVKPVAVGKPTGKRRAIVEPTDAGIARDMPEVIVEREGKPELPRLHAELRDARMRLEGTLRELESLRDEHRSVHEEALSANEELQSSNEELETAKEELQSGNEELTTVNDELQGRSAELSQTNNDLINVLSSVDMPVILVGPDLRLRRFTAMATKVLNVIASDIGRPISDITLNIPAPDLPAVVLATMETMRPHERDLQDRAGRWYSMRVRPYRTHDHKIDGAVILLVDVDESRRALAAAQEAREYADAIVSTVREPLIVLDEELRVVTANRSFYETFGVSPERTERRRLFDIGDGQWNLPRLRERLGTIPQQSSFEDFEVTDDFAGIGRRTMLLSARHIEDASGRASRILVAIEDVTERRAAEAEREHLLSIAEHARADAEGAGDLLRRVQTITDTALLELPFDDLLREVLARVLDTLGGDTAVILLRRLEWEGDEEEAEDVLHARAVIGLGEDEGRAVRVPIGRGFAGRIAAERKPAILDEVDYGQMESPYLRDKGIRSLVGVPLLAEGGLLGVLHVGSVQPRKFGSKDVEILVLAAERIAHAVEVAARRESEHRARAAAEAANRAKDEFLALLSHELRNPLSAVRNALVSARLDPVRRDRALEIAGRQAEHLTRLVEDLLDVARITQGKIRLRRDRVALRDAVDRAVESARPFIDGRGHTLSVVCSGEGVLEADPVRLEQIIGNLLTNAAKYTPPGGRIEVTCEHSGEEAVVRVRDNGVGIDARILPRIFDLFAQGDIGLDRAQGGLGIGLTVARRLVELHAGRIEVRSDGPGCGAEFIVYLPALPASEALAAVSPPLSGVVPSAGVLVVEDNADAAESLQMLLELFGHRVRVVYDGPAALAAVQAEAPDIALVDIGLPGMDGYELVRLLREQPGMAQITLVALSGYGRGEDKERALAAGFHLHLTKPVDADRLLALMAELRTAKP